MDNSEKRSPASQYRIAAYIKNPETIVSGFSQRRRPDLNRCIRVLQTHALPLGYCAISLTISDYNILINQ